MLASSKNGIWKLEIPMEEEEIVDTVGCGDVIAAGLAYSLSWKKHEEDMFAYSIACASAAAKHPGPGHSKKSEITALRDRIIPQPLDSS